MNPPPLQFVFFGSSEFSLFVLEELKTAGFFPSLIVTNPDAPKGRKLVLTSPETKVWGEKNGVEIFQPEKLDEKANAFLSHKNFDLFIVASYGKIIPKTFLDIPKYKTLNVHPSLLPKLRGASPLQTAIQEDCKETGVTIILLDEKMDHGPILAQEKVTIANWPPTYLELEKVLGHQGGKILAELIPAWTTGKIEPKEQNHTEATFTKKVEKENGLLDLSSDPYKNFLKIQAYSLWPGTYFFHKHGDKKIRLTIKEATFENNTLKIIRVIPEGKKDMLYEDFLRGLK